MLANQMKCVLLCVDHTSGCSHISQMDWVSFSWLESGPLCKLVQLDLVSFM